MVTSLVVVLVGFGCGGGEDSATSASNSNTDAGTTSGPDHALGESNIKYDALEAMEARGAVAPTTSDELTGEDPSWDDPSVNSPAQRAEIVPVSNVGDTAMPLILPLSIMKPTNGYRFSTDDTGRYVWAGARADQPLTGMVYQLAVDSSGAESGGTSMSAKTGAYTIVAFNATQLFLEGTTGQQATYNLQSRALTTCGPPLSERICPLP